MNKSQILLFILFLILFNLSSCVSLNLEQRKNLQNLETSAYNIKAKLQKRLKDSPDSILKNSISVLDNILDYADEIKISPKKFSLDKIKEYTKRIDIINENIKRFKDITLKSDVSFSSGTYKVTQLSDKGQLQCIELADKIAATIIDIHKRYPEYPIRITLKTIGYTDAVPVVSGSLESVIRRQISELKPEGRKRRQQYNKILSRLRAASINDFIMNHIQTSTPENIDVDFVQKIIGMGEAFPNISTNKPFTDHDIQRRICIISPFIEIVL